MNLKKINITLLIVALNEEMGLRAIFPKINRNLFSQIILLDGQSKDNSVQWAKSEGIDFYIQKKRGIRHAYIEVWPYIKGEYVITFSPDGNCKPEDLPLIIEKLLEGNDLVIASRYFQHAKSEDDDLLTGIGNFLFTKLINLLHRSKYTDAMTIYRGYKAKLFYTLGLDKESSYWMEKIFLTTMGIEPLLSIRAAKANILCADVPSDEPKRIFGQRKLQVFRWGACYLAQIFFEKIKKT